METSINIIPGVRRLHLVNVGPWKDASFEFSLRINVIRGRSGCGKSFILKSLFPTVHAQLTARIGSGGGTVQLEYAQPEFRYGLPAIPTSTDDLTSLSLGQKTMRMLHQALHQAKPGSCVCIEDDVFECLDAEHCARAVKMINQAECQFIIVFPNSLKTGVFRSPRVFECRADEEAKCSSVQTIDLK